MQRNQLSKYSDKFIHLSESLFWFISKFLLVKCYLVNRYNFHELYCLCFCVEKSALQLQKWLLLFVMVTCITCQIWWGIKFFFSFPISISYFYLFFIFRVFHFYLLPILSSFSLSSLPSSLLHVKTPASSQFFHTFISFIPSSPYFSHVPFLSQLYVHPIAICLPYLAMSGDNLDFPPYPSNSRR
jgi:hypothetical protein